MLAVDFYKKKSRQLTSYKGRKLKEMQMLKYFWMVVWSYIFPATLPLMKRDPKPLNRCSHYCPLFAYSSPWRHLSPSSHSEEGDMPVVFYLWWINHHIWFDICMFSQSSSLKPSFVKRSQGNSSYPLFKAWDPRRWAGKWGLKSPPPPPRTLPLCQTPSSPQIRYFLAL